MELLEPPLPLILPLFRPLPLLPLLRLQLLPCDRRCCSRSAAADATLVTPKLLLWLWLLLSPLLLQLRYG